jgi:hypothetical protein
VKDRCRPSADVYNPCPAFGLFARRKGEDDPCAKPFTRPRRLDSELAGEVRCQPYFGAGRALSAMKVATA